jgi:hypothetical protein
MSDRNVDRRLDAWVHLGPATAPNRVLEAVRLETRATKQTSGRLSRFRSHWWSDSRLTRLAVAVGAVAVAIVFVAYLTRQNVGNPSPSTSPSTSPSVATLASPSAGPSLEARGLPGMSPNEPAGVYGWQTGALFDGMHWVVEGADGDYRAVSMLFDSGPDCLHDNDAERAPVVVAGFDGVAVEPYEPVMVYGTEKGTETTRAYALDVENRTLCVFVTWEPQTTPAELEDVFEILESIKAQPLGIDAVRINFTLPAGWDTG